MFYNQVVAHISLFVMMFVTFISIYLNLLFILSTKSYRGYDLIYKMWNKQQSQLKPIPTNTPKLTRLSYQINLYKNYFFVFPTDHSDLNYKKSYKYSLQEMKNESVRNKTFANISPVDNALCYHTNECGKDK